MEKGLIPVRLIHVAEDTHTLKQGMSLGTFHPDINVEEGLAGLDGICKAVSIDWCTDSLVQETGTGQSGI